MALSHDAINAGVAPRKIQPGWVRISHWLNALAALVMMLSGWRIYNASPVFPPFRFPGDITLGGWLGGALQCTSRPCGCCSSTGSFIWR